MKYKSKYFELKGGKGNIKFIFTTIIFDDPSLRRKEERSILILGNTAYIYNDGYYTETQLKKYRHDKTYYNIEVFPEYRDLFLSGLSSSDIVYCDKCGRTYKEIRKFERYAMNGNYNMNLCKDCYDVLNEQEKSKHPLKHDITIIGNKVFSEYFILMGSDNEIVIDTNSSGNIYKRGILFNSKISEDTFEKIQYFIDNNIIIQGYILKKDSNGFIDFVSSERIFEVHIKLLQAIHNLLEEFKVKLGDEKYRILVKEKVKLLENVDDIEVTIKEGYDAVKEFEENPGDLWYDVIAVHMDDIHKLYNNIKTFRNEIIRKI